MKKLLFAAVLFCSGNAIAQGLSEEMTIALKNNDAQAMSALVTDANKDECISFGTKSTSLLVLSLQAGGEEITRMLIEDKGVDIDKVCGRYTALIWAARYGRTDLVEYLLSKGADKTIVANNKTALQLAQEKNHPEVVALLSN